MTLLSVEEALKKVTESLKCLSSESISLAKAHKRVLADAIAANLTQPPFNSSAMDGYALRASDVENTPSNLEVIGESSAGHAFEGTVQKGQAVRIFTGASVPEGADTVIMQENTDRNNNTVTINIGASAGNNIRQAGVDFAQGDVLFNKGDVLNAKSMALAAAANISELNVIRRPIVAILATGDELVEPGETPKPDQIISSIPLGLAFMIENWGGEARYLGIARDNMDSLNEKIACANDADVLVTIGGASVGDHDLVQKALKDAGMELNFWKVAMRPGKPLMYGELNNTHVLGFPGNPISAFICAQLFLSAMISKLLGGEGNIHSRHTAVLGSDISENGPRQHYMRAVSRKLQDGTTEAVPAPSQDSSLLQTFVESDCLIIREPHAPAAAKGDMVNILVT